MTEIAARNTFRAHIAPFGKLQRFENIGGAGVPDIYYRLTHPRTQAHGAGWIEAKFLEEWPARAITKVHVTLRTEQLLWAEEWAPIGERIYLFLRAPGTYMLLEAAHFRAAYEGLTRAELRRLAPVYEEVRPFPTERFLTQLTLPWPRL